MPDYQHAEAYCLMTYRSDDGSEEETIWNSRDGVTPFVVSLRSGATATHVDWYLDRRVPDYEPPPGSRMFVDLTQEAAQAHARRAAERWFSDSTAMGQMARARYATVDDMAAALAADHTAGTPDIVEVPDA